VGEDVLADLAAEQEALDAVVAGIPGPAWEVPTPSPEWRVRDQIGHLAYFDEQAALAATDPEAFAAGVDELLTEPATATALGRTLTGAALLQRWRDARHRSSAALQAIAAEAEGRRVPWYGPAMSVRSFATARLMETWAHGTDVVEGLTAAGYPAHRPDTDRLRHLCHLGAITRGWSYAVRGQDPPPGDVRVDLTLPSGAPWTFGPDAATDVVRGSAADFCLVVTQRRHVEDTALEVTGPLAVGWMAIAQCFAGAPTLAARRA
jgi:uncharacterized protein (TIGR03084 family)